MIRGQSWQVRSYHTTPLSRAEWNVRREWWDTARARRGQSRQARSYWRNPMRRESTYIVTSSESACRKYYFNVMRGTDMSGQGYLGHGELGSD